MRPFRAMETRQVRKVRVVDSRYLRHLEQRIPCLGPGSNLVFQRFESSGIRKAQKNNLPPARANLLGGLSHVAKARFDGLLHLRTENIGWDISGWWRGCKKWRPDLLDGPLKFDRANASLPHPGSSLTIDRLEIRRQARRDERARTIWDWQAHEKLRESQILLFQKGNVFFERKCQPFTDPLRGRLGMESTHYFLAVNNRRTPGWREE